MSDKIIERILVNPQTENQNRKEFPDHWERYKFAANFCKIGDCVVDVACGSGYGTNILSEKICAKAIGLDVDREALRWAAKYYGDKSIFLEISNKILPVDDGVVDVVVSLETIEHVVEQDKFLSEIKRIMKRNGILIISTPLNETPFRFKPENKFHVREYGWDELDNLLFKFFVSSQSFSQVSNLAALNEGIKNSPLGFVKKIIPSQLKKAIVKRLLRSETVKSGRIIDGKKAGAGVQLRVLIKK